MVSVENGTMPTFGENKYRYTLHINKTLSMQRSVVISALHKFMRRICTNELMFLINSFFMAVNIENDINSALSGSITNFINRFAISVFEEGAFIHVSTETQGLIVTLATSILTYRNDKKWMKCAKTMNKIVRLLHNSHRGRVASVVARYSLENRQVLTNYEKHLCQLMNPSNLERANNDIKFVAPIVKTNIPHASILLNTKYGECSEFKRVLYMNACVMPSIPLSSVAKTFTKNTIPDETPCEFTMDFLGSIGVFDCHVKGKQNSNAWYEFTQKGCRVENPTPIVIFGLTYQELELIYTQGKEDDLKQGIPQQIKKRKLTSNNSQNKKQKQIPQGSIIFHSEDELFTPGDRDGILGFKNATTCGVLKTCLSPFNCGSPIFLKIGEEYDQCCFAKRCTEIMSELNMTSVRSCVGFVKVSMQWWIDYGTRTDPTTDKKWVNTMVKRISASICIYPNNYMPFLLQDKFEGEKLSSLSEFDPRLKTTSFGKSLLQTILFSKYFGVKDFGPYNTMVDSDGNVMQVDLNSADMVRISTYNAKGLFTSHKFNHYIVNSAKKYGNNNINDVVQFIQKMKKYPIAKGVICNLFTDDCIATMLNGNTECLNELF